MKKLILITVLALGSLAHAQGIVSNISIGVGFQGVLPSSTFTRHAAELDVFNGATQSTTNSIGVNADARYDFGRHSALGLAFGLNRNTEVYYAGEGPTRARVQTNNAEIIGSYIFRLPSNDRVKPYAMFGGGMIRFSPNNNFESGLPPQTESKAAFAYGFGTDLKFSDHWGVRLQYRGLVRTSPDFKIASEPFGTQLHTHVAEPGIQLVYHF